MMQYDGDLQDARSTSWCSRRRSSARWASTWRTTRITQLAISETQKFGHVTYFWNGNRSGKFDDELETYVEIPSDTRARSQSGRG